MKKVNPDVRMKSPCFMFINYRQYILELGGGKNTICCTTGQEIHPWVLWIQACLWIQRVSFVFCSEKTGREEDLRFNLWTRWKAKTDVRSEK